MSGFEPKSGSKLQSIWKHRFFIVTLQSIRENALRVWAAARQFE